LIVITEASIDKRQIEGRDVSVCGLSFQVLEQLQGLNMLSGDCVNVAKSG
jgi:hypothetical protein